MDKSGKVATDAFLYRDALFVALPDGAVCEITGEPRFIKGDERHSVDLWDPRPWFGEFGYCGPLRPLTPAARRMLDGR